ncbi:MAG: ribonuclease III [Clostridiales bacterium]|nr:ribonuclease III [Clostridiales bacterium]
MNSRPKKANRKERAESSDHAERTELPLELNLLEAEIGYTFSDISRLRTATTHSSYANEQRARGITVESNERMEFLGDSVLSLIVSDYLFENYPTMPEGDLSPIRSTVVCEETLAKFAKSISLGSYLLLGHGESITDGRRRPSILSDAFESLLAAIYLDGGYDAARDFLLPKLTPQIEKRAETGRFRDYKTQLQQLIQQGGSGDILEYVTVGESGPMHMRVFEVEARLNSNIIGRGVARSKRSAEQLAAKEALELFGEE